MSIIKEQQQKINHAHLAEDENEESPRKRTRGEYVEEYGLFYAFFRSVTPREDTWLIDSGSSKNMTVKKTTLSNIEEKNSSQKVSLGDDYQYPIKGIVESSYKIEFGTSMEMKKLLYVPCLKKNLISISTLDKKGHRFAFIDGQVLMWSKGKTLEDV